MGVDIYRGSGVIATTDQVLKIVNSKTKSLIIEGCRLWYEGLVEHEYADEEEFDLFAPIKDIPKKSTIKQVREALASVVVVGGDADKRYGDCWVQSDEFVCDLFQRLLYAANFSLPYLAEVTAFGSNRYNGYDVPKGVACFVFDDNDCFIQKLSVNGKKLEKLIGHCDKSEWTIYSV